MYLRYTELFLQKWGALGYAESDLGLPIRIKNRELGNIVSLKAEILVGCYANDYVVKLNNVVSTITVGQGATTPEITQKFIEACDQMVD